MSEPLQLPYPYSMPAGDVILRTAIQAAFDDVRANPWLLDFCLSFFTADALTVKEYGQKELDRCKDWFLSNDVKVTMGTNVQTLEVPHIAIWPGAQNEAEATTGDVNDTALIKIPWPVPPAAVATFSALSYDPTSGIIMVPTSVDLSRVFDTDLVLDRKSGKTYPVLDIGDQQITIAAGSLPNLNQAQIVRGAYQTTLITLESITTQDNYQIDVIVPGDATMCLVLHTILMFCLYRYKQTLLEGRGYERTSYTSTGINGVKNGGQSVQLMFQRGVSVSGYIRSFWPKKKGSPLAGMVPGTPKQFGFQVPGGAEVNPQDYDSVGPRLWTSVEDTPDPEEPAQ